jgi:mono/diheme cytochrome c family protein
MRNYFNILFITIGTTILISAASAQSYSPEGAEIYTDYCEACHMVNGKGYEDIYPALKNNEIVLGDQDELRGTEYVSDSKWWMVIVVRRPYDTHVTYYKV